MTIDKRIACGGLVVWDASSLRASTAMGCGFEECDLFILAPNGLQPPKFAHAAHATLYTQAPVMMSQAGRLQLPR